MDVAEADKSAVQQVRDELTPLLREYAIEYGLPQEQADSLDLVWTGNTFQATSHLALDDFEYGTGEGPAPRPVHKALNRLHRDAEKLLTQLVLERMAQTTRPGA